MSSFEWVKTGKTGGKKYLPAMMPAQQKHYEEEDRKYRFHEVLAARQEESRIWAYRLKYRQYKAAEEEKRLHVEETSPDLEHDPPGYMSGENPNPAKTAVAVVDDSEAPADA